MGPQMMRRAIVSAVLAVALVAAGIGGFIAYRHSEFYEIRVANGAGEESLRLAAMTLLLNREDPDRVVPVFIKLLDDKAPTIRAKAAEDLGFMGAASAVEPLLAALPKQGPPERPTFIEALGAIGDPRAIAPLAAALDGAAEGEARSLTRALANLGPEVVPLLIKRLVDPRPSIRAAAAAGLGWFAIEARTQAKKEALAPAIAPLIPLLYDTIPTVRSSAADAMGDIRDPKFLTSLVLALGDPDDQVREVIGRAISYYGDAAIAVLPPAFQSSDPRTRLGAAEAFAAIADIGVYAPNRAGASYVKAAQAVLDEALERNDLIAGAGAFGYYITQGRPEAVPFLIAALQAYGHRRMANGLLNCGLVALHDAAASWASAHGFTIETGSGPGEYKWGKG
ncbi:MAG: HEAT repeat domain-containing protein [Hyphomicrobiales bacterium]